MTQLFHAVRSMAEVPTPEASRYLQQLCRQFRRHRHPVIFDERAGRIEFSFGECRLDADGGTLRLSLSAPSHRQMGELQDVIASHLVRLAFRKPPRIAWRPTDVAGGDPGEQPSADRQVIRAVETLRRAMGRRLGRAPINQTAAETIAAALAAAAQIVEHS